MRKFATSLLSALMLTMTIQPAFSADAGEIGKQALKLPLTMASFAVGTVVGTPIAVVRKVAGDTMDTHQQIAGDKGAAMCAVGCLFCLPVGLFTGSLEGLWLGPKNALYHSGETPFGKECFSLGDLDE